MDASQSGKHLEKELSEFFETGRPVTIPNAAIKNIDIPEILTAFGIQKPTSIAGLTLSQVPRRVGRFTIKKTYGPDKVELLESIELVNVQSGTARIHLESPQDAGAFKLVLDIDLTSKTLAFSFRPDILGKNAWAASKALAFGLALSRRGHIDLIHCETGITAIRGEAAPCNITFPAALAELLEKVATVQEKTGTLIRIKRDITQEDTDEVQKAFVAVTEGEIPVGTFSFSMTLSEEFASRPYPDAPGRYVMKHSQPGYVTSILDTLIDLGPVEIVAEKAVLKLEDVKGTSAEQPAGMRQMRLEPVDDQPIYLKFLRYSDTESPEYGTET